MFQGLVYNIALIMAMVTLYTAAYRRFSYQTLGFPLITGFLFGGIALIAMRFTVSLTPGIVFDGRSIIISIAGFFGGPMAAVISASVTALYRIHMGGNGTIMGVSVIIASAAVGALYHHIRKKSPGRITLPYLFAFGVIVHVIMLLLTLTLPGDIWPFVLQSIWIPVLAVYPVATVVICKLLLDQESRFIAEEALRESEERYRAIANAAQDIIFSKDNNRRYTFVNPSMEKLLGKPAGEIIGRTPEEIFDADTAAVIRDVDVPVLQGSVANEIRTLRLKEREVVLQTIQAPLYDRSNAIIGISGIVRDITELHIKEEQLQRSLREKEILLKEIHHRVKNNMQVISSLLSLQLQSIDNEFYRSLFIDSQNRIKSMALIHEQLYQADNLSEINFHQYLNNLSAVIQSSYFRTPHDVRIDLNIADIFLGVNSAIPCALILNELMTNAIKHARPHDEMLRITVDFSRGTDGRFRFSVADNGLPLENDLDLENVASMGLNLVKALVKQLRGAIAVQRTPNLRFIVDFPEGQ